MAESSTATDKESGVPGRSRSGVEFDVSSFMQELGCTESHMVMGIDEAGRGPIIGPMVYVGAMIALHEHDLLLTHCGANDSKVLDENQREVVLQKLSELKTFRTFTIVITPDEIAAAMTGIHGINLNTLSHNAATSIISQLTLQAAGMLCAAYVDTVGPPEKYESKLSGRFPHLRVKVSKQAESKFPIVAAASVVAKVKRDGYIRRLGVDVGSGYPSDPKAVAWVRSHVHRFFMVPRKYNFVRLSWSPVMQLGKEEGVCIPLVFEEDTKTKIEKKNSRGSNDGKRQTLLNFGKAPPRRHSVYAHLLKLKMISHFSDAQHPFVR
ncbi:putative Ribonuclease HII [Trypanosoma vivax]|nr:putative Ribonuclease HII [Trypanosoma vivax]